MPAPSPSRMGIRAKPRSALRFRRLSGRLLSPEDVDVDLVEQADQCGRCIPGSPGTPAASENDLGVERLADVCGQRRRNVAAVEADELAAFPMHEGRILAEPASLGLA